MMAPAISLVSFAIASIAQVIAYPVLVFYVLLLFRFSGRVPVLSLLAITPVLAWLTWFGYDRIVPDYRFMLDERPPYEHGLTLNRFLLSWAWSAAITFGFWWPLRKIQLTCAAPGEAPT
jgi:hypothetical protein